MNRKQSKIYSVVIEMSPGAKNSRNLKRRQAAYFLSS